MSQRLHHQTALLQSVGLLGRGTAQDRRYLTVELLSGGSRHRSRVTFALTGRCIPVQPVSCQSTTQITTLQQAPQANTNSAVFSRAAAASHPSSSSRTPPCAEAMNQTRQTPTAGPALNQIIYYRLYLSDQRLSTAITGFTSSAMHTAGFMWLAGMELRGRPACGSHACCANRGLGYCLNAVSVALRWHRMGHVW